VRQQSYRLRTSTWTAYYQLALRANPDDDAKLLHTAKSVIEKARYSGTESEDFTALNERSGAAKVELENFIELVRCNRSES
jgi:hypothetical protein